MKYLNLHSLMYLMKQKTYAYDQTVNGATLGEPENK